jgi:formate--tetrahydrofolate ligase
LTSSLEIAQAAELRPIVSIAEQLGLQPDEFDPYGRHKAKIDPSVLERLGTVQPGKLVCVTGITPTRAGEGKTTTAVGLTQALGSLGRRPVLCLREPSLAPVFGVKGGAAGGGRAQVVPMEDINLHFTGDFHAIGAANNLLAAMIDASILHGNPHSIDALRISWRRALDINDRALRETVIGLGGRANGYPRETGFDITAASEVMGIVAVSRDLKDLRHRLGAITIGHSYGDQLVTADEIGVAGAMAVLLKDAIRPNLIQTLEGQPCLMHCGPYGSIDHGNSSLVADLIGLRLGEFAVTECGFGADMGMEKLFDIVCRVGGLVPSCAVLVCTVRALQHHAGRGDQARIEGPKGMAAIVEGSANLAHHIGLVRDFGVPCVVAVNRWPGDTDDEITLARDLALEAGAAAAEIHDGFEHGGAGAEALASAVIDACDRPSSFRFLYEDEAPLLEKIDTVAKRVYGAGEVLLYPAAEQKLAQYEADGLGQLPVCIVKTHLSLSADPERLGAPEGFRLPVRDMRAYTGAGWVVPLCGDTPQMPALGRSPAAHHVDIDERGRTVGLF